MLHRLHRTYYYFHLFIGFVRVIEDMNARDHEQQQQRQQHRQSSRRHVVVLHKHTIEMREEKKNEKLKFKLKL